MGTSNVTIMIVEDNDIVAGMLETLLEEEGFAIIRAVSAQEVLSLLAECSPSLMLLDVGLPGGNGFELCKRLRGLGHRFPLIMLTGRGDEIDRVLGLELGADDYVTKPFAPRELISRIHAQLRRAYGEFSADTGTISSSPRFGPFELDRQKIRLVKRGGDEIPLTPVEYRILSFLIQNEEQVFSRRQILDHVREEGMLFGDERVVDVHIRHLREKIEEDPGHPQFIRTLRGFGYSFTKNL